MRRRPTKHERIFALRLKESGIEFKPQMILGFFIVDFVLPNKMLCIEIDGMSHAQRKAYDWMRDQFIEASGFRVIRIKNEEAATYPLDEILSLPVSPPQKFKSGCARANMFKGLSKDGYSSLPTIGQRALF